MKSFIKTNVVQLIAVILILAGITLLRGVRFAQISGRSIVIFDDIYLNLVFVGIAIYAGIQLIRLQEVGRKLAIIWLCYLLLVALINQLSNYFSSDTPYFLIPPGTKYPILLVGLYLFDLVALNQLHDDKIIDRMIKNEGLSRRIGMILARCMPGLGRALTGSVPLGLGLCLLYIYFMRGAILQQDMIRMFLLGAMTWSLFSTIDSVAVRKAFEVRQKANSITKSVSD